MHADPAWIAEDEHVTGKSIFFRHSAYQDREKLYMLMEFAPGGELFKHRKDCTSQFGLEAAKFYVASILLALEYLHSNSVIYRLLLCAPAYAQVPNACIGDSACTTALPADPA